MEYYHFIICDDLLTCFIQLNSQKKQKCSFIKFVYRYLRDEFKYKNNKIKFKNNLNLISVSQN